MNLFEDKKHNDPKYVGQVPVTAVPEDINRRNQVGNIDRPLVRPHGVVSVPDSMARVFPGNPGPPNGEARNSPSFDERFPRGVWSGGRGPSIDRAFSGDDPSKTEFPLGRALKEKAERMKK